MLKFIVSRLSIAILTVITKIVHDRFKRPVPDYDFDFEKEIPYRGYTIQGFFYYPPIEYLENYIYVKNDGDVCLSDITTEIYFENKTERSHYQIMEITDNLFNLEIEDLSTPLPNHPEPILLDRSREEVIAERTETGFFIDASDMEKLKRISPVKVKVEYKWKGKKGSDIWLFDFSDDNEVRFRMARLTFGQKIKLLLKRIF